METSTLTETTKSTTMNDQNVSVIYSWKAKEGKLDALKAIYEQVADIMRDNEPGALRMDFYVNEAENEIVVYDLFADANAVGFHLGTTAASHFPALLEIAVPGKFTFGGSLPEEMKAQITGMGLPADFNNFVKGFQK